ncbi:nuclear transport factor 2 family protein [Roseateles violae]|uniref:Nuclear transport factor 2 family protein n=1 Tax=Roseateles violae TaxID=3058042 RepID=A0ABT8DSS7_9BURK|nr:nuclear transport factor 2 family protein [Pelomonas sp. PFR6]MDN3921372.1 nuclear transport factor 2 family protein [Pelomonas sp. PFR6]
MPANTPDPSLLLQELQALEVELHHPGVRCSAERLEQLLHPDFHEVGRSGRRYERTTIVRFLAAQTAHPEVEPGEFAVALLGGSCALLTYRSAHRQADGSLGHHTHRASIWIRGSAGWQLRYHQGTPAAEAWP